ncbi:MAG: hypothetical protein ACRCTT_18655 [Enterobacter roggenkampii]
MIDKSTYQALRDAGLSHFDAVSSAGGDPRVSYFWPSDHKAECERRIRLLHRLRADPELARAAHIHYKHHPVDWCLDWATTYDPRNATRGLPTLMPFSMFERQTDLIQFLHSCVLDEENGLIEKARDMGATVAASAFSVWLWLYWPGAAIGFGSRKEELVDRLGDPKTIFDKLRSCIRNLPSDLFWPKGFHPDKHMTYMKIINPSNGATIAGEAGDNIGRGGRTLIYFKDESAHYERPELIEAALGDNTNVQIDISSVNGMGNVFHRRRMAGFEWNPGCTAPPGKTRIFIMDWSDHPGKTQTWYDARRQKAEDEGLLHVFAQEVDRDYSAAVENILIPAAWVQAAKGAHLKLNLSPSGKRTAGMDVADGGSDVNALCMMRGMLVEHMETLAGDGDDAYYDFHAKAAQRGAHEFWYDVTGIGRAAKVAAKNTENEMPVFAWVPSGAVVNPHESIMGDGDEDVTRTNRDHYATLKAQAWFYLRRRFKKTFDWVRNGIPCDPDDIISLPEKAPWVDKLITELGQVTYGYQSGGKVIVNKAPAGTKSPNMADALVIAAMQPKPNAKVIARRATPRAGLVQSGAGNYDGL